MPPINDLQPDRVNLAAAWNFTGILRKNGVDVVTFDDLPEVFIVSIDAGTGIDIDITDPANPIVSLDSVTLASLALADSAVQNLADLSITASAAELNVLDGITATTAELNYMDGVTSSVQTQLNAKAADNAVMHLTGDETASGRKYFSGYVGIGVANAGDIKLVIDGGNQTNIAAMHVKGNNGTGGISFANYGSGNASGELMGYSGGRWNISGTNAGGFMHTVSGNLSLNSGMSAFDYRTDAGAAGAARSLVGWKQGGSAPYLQAFNASDIKVIEFAYDGSAEFAGTVSVATPTADEHATTKEYVDDEIAAITATDVGLGNVDNTSDATKNSASATLTNKDISGTSNTLTKRSTATSSATPTPTGDGDFNHYSLTALAANAVFAAPSGTPKEGNKLVIRVTPDATPRTLGFNAIYRAIGVTLPTTTVASKTLYLGAVYNSTDSVWDVIAYGVQA